MPKPPTVRMWRKAARLLYQQRVRLLAHGRLGCEAEVRGDTGTYVVMLAPHEQACGCRFAQVYARRHCSHMLATLMVWRALYPATEFDPRERQRAGGTF